MRYERTSDLSLLEKAVLCFHFELVHAQLEDFKTPGPLLKDMQSINVALE